MNKQDLEFIEKKINRESKKIKVNRLVEDEGKAAAMDHASDLIDHWYCKKNG